MAVTANGGSSDWDVPQSALRRRRMHPEGNPPPNLLSKLADDLLVEILIRLPHPRPSCRCKAVCKRWRSVISDPSFNRRFIAHHQSRNQPAAALFLPAHDPQPMLSFLPVPDQARPHFRVLDCFKDLLLCGFLPDCGELRKSYLVCNPFTEQWVALPLAPERPPGCTSRFGFAAGLVCQPRSTGNYNLVQQQLGLGDESEPAFGYSEYHGFRVVCLFIAPMRLLLQVFCSKSGEWTQLYLPNTVKMANVNAVCCNGKLFWVQCEVSPLNLEVDLILAAYNPFRLQTAPKSVRLPPALRMAFLDRHANISVSQGALHIIVFQVDQGSSRYALSVWRRDEKRGRWTKSYETVLTTSLWGDYELGKSSVLDLHPDNPGIVYFKYSDDRVLSCNLSNGTTGEPEFVSAVPPQLYQPCWRVLQPRVPCWPSPIPRYEDLRGMYDGSYDCWVQYRSTTSRLFDEKEWNALLAAVKQCGIRDWGLVKQQMRTRRSRDTIRQQWKRLVEVAQGVTRGRIPNRVLEKVRIILRDFAALKLQHSC